MRVIDAVASKLARHTIGVLAPAGFLGSGPDYLYQIAVTIEVGIQCDKRDLLHVSDARVKQVSAL